MGTGATCRICSTLSFLGCGNACSKVIVCVCRLVRSTVREVLERIDGGVEDLGSETAYEEAVLRAFPLQGDEATAKRVKR